MTAPRVFTQQFASTQGIVAAPSVDDFIWLDDGLFGYVLRDIQVGLFDIDPGDTIVYVTFEDALTGAACPILLYNDAGAPGAPRTATAQWQGRLRTKPGDQLLLQGGSGNGVPLYRVIVTGYAFQLGGPP